MAISNMFMTLNHYGMLFPPFSNMYAMSSICDSTYKDKKLVLIDCYFEEAKLLAENVLNVVNSAKKIKPTDWKYDNKAN